MRLNIRNNFNNIKPVGAGLMPAKLQRNTGLKNTQRGITLVALIITIIILLILATVSIRLVINEGIINKAEQGTQKYSDAEIKEQIKLAYEEWKMGKYSGETAIAQEFIDDRLEEVLGLNEEEVTVTGNLKINIKGKEYFYNANAGEIENSEINLYPAATPGTVTTENSKYTSNEKTAVIPAGYTVSEVTTEQSIDTGLVIKKDGNEWVWIPVANVMDLYDTNISNEEWVLCGTSGENKVVTQYKSKSEILSGKMRIIPGDTSGYKEPDTVIRFRNRI